MICYFRFTGAGRHGEDPTDWVVEQFPWTVGSVKDDRSLLRIRPEDVGYDAQLGPVPAGTSKIKSQSGTSDTEADPLVGALLLQQTTTLSLFS